MSSALPGLDARAFNGTSARTRVGTCMSQFVLPGRLEGWPYVPCLRARTDRKAGLALGKRSAWLMLSMLRNSDAGLRF